MNIYILAGIIIAAFWITLYLVGRYWRFDSIDLEIYPGMMMWRTKRGVGLLDRISNVGKRVWSFFGSLSAVLGTVIMFGALGFLTYSIIDYILMALSPSGAPSVPSEAAEKIVPIPGLNVPLILGGIALVSVILIHEGSHGVVLRNLKIKVKNVGLALFILIPGAFVEQDDEDFEEAEPESRIKVASAGPISNVLFGLVCFGLILILISPQPGVFVTGVSENYPAGEAGIEPGSRIRSIGNQEIMYSEHFSNFMKNTRPGDVVSITMENGRTYDVILADDPYDNKEGFLGVSTFGPVHESKLVNPMSFFLGIPYSTLLGYGTDIVPIINDKIYNASVDWMFIDLLLWLLSLHALVAIFNLLPLKPLDGGHIIDGIADKVTSGREKKLIVGLTSGLTLFILFMNVFALF